MNRQYCCRKHRKCTGKCKKNEGIAFELKGSRSPTHTRTCMGGTLYLGIWSLTIFMTQSLNDIIFK